MMGLTRKQHELYDFIGIYLAKHGYAPTYDEMAEAVGLASKGRIGEILAALEERGYIKRIPNRPRAIEILPQGHAVELNSEILTLVDRYADAHGIKRRTAANELLRIALGAAA